MVVANRSYSPELRAQVAAEYATLGTPKSMLARKYDVSRGAVQLWTRGVQAVLISEKRADIDALFTEFVAETLMALRQTARLGQDEAWLRSLKPGEAYLWFGTLADKVLAALSAYQSASERGNDNELHPPRTSSETS